MTHYPHHIILSLTVTDFLKLNSIIRLFFRRETFFQDAYFLHTEVPANNTLGSQFQRKIHKHTKPRVLFSIAEIYLN